MIDSEDIQRYSASPMAFAEDLSIPSANGSARFGDCMADFQRARFAALFPALLAVAAGTKPPCGKYFWEATKGASKDSDLAVALLWLLAFSTRPLTCQSGAADRDQADELRKASKDVLRLNPWLESAIEIQAGAIIGTRSGSRCDILTSDVGGSHGSRPDVLFVDELSHITKREFAETLLDNATKMPNGLVVVATNAGHVGTWQYKWRENARLSDRWTFDKWDKPAPWLDAADIEEAKLRNSTSRYLRLWEGVWASGTGDALEASDIRAAVTLPGPSYYAETGISYLAGLDLGVKRDHSALVVVGAHHATGRVKLASAESWKPTPGGSVNLELVRQAVLRVRRVFGVTGCFYDPWQAEYMAQTLRNDGVRMEPMPFTGANLTKMASVLLETFRSHRIDLFPDAELIADLERLSIVERSYGYRLESTRDEAGHADRATALAIVLPTATELSAVTLVPFINDGLGDNLLRAIR